MSLYTGQLFLHSVHKVRSIIKKKEIKIGLLGYGTVGSGVAKIIHGHQQDLAL